MIGGPYTWDLKILDSAVLWSPWEGVLEMPVRQWSGMWVSNWYSPKQGHQCPVFPSILCTAPSVPLPALASSSSLACYVCLHLFSVAYLSMASPITEVLQEASPASSQGFPPHQPCPHLLSSPPPSSVLPWGLLKLTLHGSAFPGLPALHPSTLLIPITETASHALEQKPYFLLSSLLKIQLF